jgi:hypothetical protein
VTQPFVIQSFEARHGNKRAAAINTTTDVTQPFVIQSFEARHNNKRAAATNTIDVTQSFVIQSFEARRSNKRAADTKQQISVNHLSQNCRFFIWRFLLFLGFEQ